VDLLCDCEDADECDADKLVYENADADLQDECSANLDQAEEDAQSKQPVKWREIIRNQPFRKLLWVSFIWAIFMGGLLGFIVKFLKTGEGALPDDRVLYASAAKFVGGLITLWFLYSRLDRLGSRPLMFLALGILGLVMAMWIGMSGGKILVRFEWVCAVYFVMGFGFCTFYMSLTKLAMATVPELGKSHFFALYSVVGSLAVGIFPILWGILIDALTGVKVNWLGLEWNQFSIYFTALLVVLIATAVQVLRVEEQKAARLNELVFDLLRNNPLREWMRR
jgi:MFS family permease